MIDTLLEVAGLGSLTLAGFLVALPLGFAALGCSCLLLAYGVVKGRA